MGLGIGFGVNWGSIKLGLAKLLPSFVLDFANIANDFNFTRSSFATRVNEFGLIETVTDLSSDLVQNGDFEEIGSELVVGGDFGEGKLSWILATGHTIGDGVLKINSTGYKITTQSETLTVGKTYKVTLDVLNYVNGRVSIGLAGGDANNTTPNVTSNGSYEFYVTRVSGGTNNISIITDVSSELEIDNVSVKQVDPNDDWSKEGSWSIQSGYAESTALNTRSLYQDIGNAVVGKKYKVAYTILETNGGNFRFTYGGVNGTIRNNIGTYTEIITATSSSDSNIYFDALNVMIGKIDNVSVKEVLENDIPRIDYTNSTFENVLGSELVSNGAFDTDTDWTKDTSWTISGGKSTYDGITNVQDIRQDVAFQSGKTYEINFTISDVDEVGGKQAYFALWTISNNSERIFTYTKFNNGTYTFYYTANIGSILMFNALNSANGGAFSLDNVSVKEVTGEIATDKGEFLLEPQSTNLLPYSEDFTQWNAINNSVVTPNSVISPDGTMNATQLDFDQTITTSRIEVPINIATASDVVFSFYAKSVSGSDVNFGVEIGSASAPEILYTATSEWQRFERVGTTNGGVNLYPQIEAWTTNNPSIYIWGAQFEALDYSTSYIPTSGSTVTRSAESCVDATPTINSEEGVLYAEISALADSSDFRVIELNDKTALNRVLFYYRDNDRITFNIKINNVNVLSKNILSANVTDTHKLALLWSQDNFSAWLDGVKVMTITSGNTFAPNTLIDLDFSDPFSNLNFYGRTKDLKIYDKALSDDELIELTTI